MRPILWLILIASFSVGIACAFAIRTYYFEVSPVVVVAEPGPTLKILVAKHEIPRGMEITADLVEFQEVAASEIPAKALMNFSEVYRRTPAYPIPVGCPICEDLLIPPVKKEEIATFLPAGTQLVTVEIDQVLQGTKAVQADSSLSTFSLSNERIDIRVIPRRDSHGKLAKKKNEVLRAFVAPNDLIEEGELVLENVAVHNVQQKPSVNSTTQSLVLLLDQSEVSKLSAAARKGKFRVLIRHKEPEPMSPETKPVWEVAQPQSQVKQPELETQTEPIKTEIAAVPAFEAPVLTHAEPVIQPAPVPDISSEIAEALAQKPEATKKKDRLELTFIPPQVTFQERTEIMPEIRNESPRVSVIPFVTIPSKESTFRKPPPAPPKKRELNSSNPADDPYSPFQLQQRGETTTPDSPVEPRLLRSGKKEAAVK
jgi:Flp pilus assembly protein CpaB